MGKSQARRDDLIDVTPILEVVDTLVERCQDAAVSLGIHRYEGEKVHDWALEQYRVYRSPVRMAMNALLARDCAWGVADLDHPHLDRYAWELAEEFSDQKREPLRNRFLERGWLHPVGEFESCGDLYEVLLTWHGAISERPPHLLVRKVHIPPIPGVHVDLLEPVYLRDGDRHWQFDDRHRDDFAAFMESPAEGRQGRTHWDAAVDIWNEANPESDSDGADGRQTRRMPDYRQLHWPADTQSADAQSQEGERPC